MQRRGFLGAMLAAAAAPAYVRAESLMGIFVPKTYHTGGIISPLSEVEASMVRLQNYQYVEFEAHIVKCIAVSIGVGYAELKYVDQFQRARVMKASLISGPANR